MDTRIGGPDLSGAPVNSTADWQQRQQAFQQLTSSLQSGDLNAAQQAFANLGSKAGTQGNGPLAQLGQALNNGDLAGAQQAMQALQSRATRHHHHHGGSHAGASATPSPTNTPGTGAIINLTA